MTDIRFGTIGGGEAGTAIAQSLFEAYGWQIVCFDIKELSGTACQEMVTDRAELSAKSDIILSVVTADEAVNAARQIAPYLKEGQIYLDGNSVSPATKQEAAAIITSAGAHYVDMAIMAPIHPRRHQTPMIVAGPDEALVQPL